MAISTKKDMAHAVAVAVAYLFSDDAGHFIGHVEREPNSDKIYVVTDLDSSYPRRWEITVATQPVTSPATTSSRATV